MKVARIALFDYIAPLAEAAPPEVAELLDDGEVTALEHRMKRLLHARVLPADLTGRRYPWPLCNRASMLGLCNGRYVSRRSNVSCPRHNETGSLIRHSEINPGQLLKPIEPVEDCVPVAK